MKILHTADWHLGKKLQHLSRLEEQKEVLQEICEIADEYEVDAVIIAGDLFDTFNPSSESIELFYKTLKKLTKNGTRPVIAIAGNHDSPDRIEAPNPLARECGIILLGYPNSKVSSFQLETGVATTKIDEGFVELSLPNFDYPLRLILTPYANEYRMKTFLGIEDKEQELRNVLTAKWSDLANKYCDNKGVNILVTHLFVIKEGNTPQLEPDDEKPILYVGGAQVIHSNNIPKQIQYVALGHLHRKQIVDNEPCPIAYSSSPIAYSFSEVNQDKYVVLVEAKPNQTVNIKSIQLKKGKRLLRECFDNMESALEWLKLHKDTLVEITMVSDTFLTSQEQRTLHNIHDGIIAVIPDIKGGNSLLREKKNINLEQDIETLFNQYFESKHGQKPNQEIIQLFKEVLS